MDKKKIIIIIVVIAAIAIAGGYFLMNNHSLTSYNTIRLSKSAYMEVPAVPDAKSNGKADKDGIYHYVDKDNGINITSCNANISKKSSVAKMEKLKNETESNSTKIHEDSVIVYEKNGTYTIFIKDIEYNNTVMLQSFDKGLLMACWQSLNFHDPTDTFKFGNTSSSSSSSVVVDAVQETQSVVGDVSSESSSSDTSSYTSSSSESSSSSYEDTSYTTSGDSWSYGGYGSSDSGSESTSSSDRGYTDYDFSEK